MSLVSLDLLRLSASLPLPKKTYSSTVPWIREATFGHTLGIRSKVLANNATLQTGPPDLVHWGRHYGERSSTFTNDDFAPPGHLGHTKDEDGYVGHFHFCNGIGTGVAAVEDHVLGSIGLEQRGGAYFWQRNVDLASYGTYYQKQMVVTFCLYNTFARSEFRARYVLSPGTSRSTAVVVDSAYTVTSRTLRKSHSYTLATLSELDAGFWSELAVSGLVRLFAAVDDPALQLCGTASLPSQIGDKDALLGAIDRVVSLLPKGHLAGCRPCFGVATGCGTDAKTSRYRNRLVDTLVRLVSLDGSGLAAASTVDALKSSGHDFDYVQARVLRYYARNQDQEFLRLVHTHLAKFPSSTQSALLLVEQVRFLIAKGSYAVARQMAARAVGMLPLDFDCWYHFALCYVLENKHENALATINALPVLMARRPVGTIEGITDTYSQCFLERQAQGMGISHDTFEAFFPPPKCGDTDEGSVQGMYQMLHARPQLRHPLVGVLYQSPLSSATAMEISAVDVHLAKVASAGSARHALAAQSTGTWVSSLDFDRSSTWGRVYDLVTLMVALVGWDNLVHVKAKTFTRPEKSSGNFVVDHTLESPVECQKWLEQLFLVVYDDIRAMMVVGLQTEQHRSALSWELIGLVGWSCKYNLKDSVSSLATSVMGVAAGGGFDYFGTVKLLEIYDEFVLSDVDASTIDPLTCTYDHRSYLNKLIVQTVSPKVYQDFVRHLVNGHLSLDMVLLHVMKLASWNLRWHSYVPSFLVINTLIKLCAKYDPVQIRTSCRVVFERHKAPPARAKPTKFSIQSLFGATKVAQQVHDFRDSDTVVEYIDRTICWIELMHA